MKISQATASRNAVTVTRPQFTFVSDDELERLPPPEWLIDNVLPAGGFALLMGEPASGKSFLAIRIAYCLATGTPLGDS